MNKNYNDMSSQSGIGIGLMIYVTCSFSYRSHISERAACSGLAKVIINIMGMHITLKCMTHYSVICLGEKLRNY